LNLLLYLQASPDTSGGILKILQNHARFDQEPAEIDE
jgi:hypothetical protein